LSFCDSSGLHAFLRLNREAEEHERLLQLRRPQSAVRKLFDLAGMSSLLATNDC
jgi:ABC-type transporter Mla MlaB component